MHSFFERINISKKSVVISTFIALFAIGIFLRTYHFREWLYFYPDQARDASIVEDVIRGNTGWPMLGPIAASTPFRIGPMYYYFQILSAKIFGIGPEKMAYPDLFFGILSIPLLYYFLRRFFGIHLSLAMMGLYAISFYAIRYSRFAWNPNPIPFFVMLFLLALSEFLWKKEKTKWWWIVLIGVTTGVGMQLHTILFLLLPAVIFFVAMYLLVKKPLVWKKIAVILLITILLNVPQIVSEATTNFSNTRLLFHLSSGASGDSESNFLKDFTQDILCNAQANIVILSSLGNNDDCNFFSNIVKIRQNKLHSDPSAFLLLGGSFLSVLFLCCGLWALFYYRRKIEVGTRERYLLDIILLYATLSFIIMFPVIEGMSLRYFIYLIFFPFLLLAFMLRFILEKCSHIFLYFSIGAIGMLFIFNFLTLQSEAIAHFEKNKSTARYIVLGEIEQMCDFMVEQADPKKEAYVFGNSRYIQNYIKPFTYVSSKRGLKILRTPKNVNDIPRGAVIFYITQSYNTDTSEVIGRQTGVFKQFGRNIIYKLKND